MTLLTALDHQATLERSQLVKNSHGENAEEWHILAHDLACHYSERAVRQTGTEFGAPAYVATYTLMVGPEANVQEGDRVSEIRLGDEAAATGVFAVVTVLRKRGPLGIHHQTALMERVKLRSEESL